MVITPHVLAGATVAVGIQNPLGVIIGALAMHHLLDLIPHWAYDISNFKKATPKIAADIALASASLLGIIWSLPPEQQALMLLGGFFGTLPDGLLLITMLSRGKYFSHYTAFHNLSHRVFVKRTAHIPLFPIGLVTQIVAVVLSFNVFALL